MNFIQDTTNEMLKNIVKQKEDVILMRLENMGYKIDLEIERKSRFKSMLCERSEDLETWYYRDGTEEGLRIVTFQEEKQDYFDLEPLQIRITLKYF